jgi:hypothetical protein
VTGEEPFPLTVFAPEKLLRTPQVGAHIPETWAGFLRWVSAPVVAVTKDAEGGFTLATLLGGVRRKANVVSVTALALDHDEGSTNAAAAHEAVGLYAHVVFTTHSHTPERPRWRAVIPFDRPVSGAEYEAIYRFAVAVLVKDGVVLDETTKDPCRLWYVPAVRFRGAPFEVHIGEGRPLRVDLMLESIAKAKAREPKRPPPAAVLDEHRDRYVRGAIRSGEQAVASASEGSRHLVLSQQAYGLARPALHLSEAQVMGALLPAFIHAAGERRAHEGERTIRDAYRARRGGE